MSKLTLTKPIYFYYFEDIEKWIVYIVSDGLLTGETGEGETPKEATEAALQKIDQQYKRE